MIRCYHMPVSYPTFERVKERGLALYKASGCGDGAAPELRSLEGLR